MIQHTFDAALGSKLLDRVILTTDNEEIAEFGRHCGIDVPFMRPDSLATDEATTRSVQQHCLRWLESNEGYVPEAVVTLQPTSPLRKARHIDECIQEFRDRGVDSAISVSPVSEHPYEVVGFADGKMFRPVQRPEEFLRRQETPPYFHINGAVYVMRSSVLLDGDTGYGELVYGYEMDPQYSIDIDILFDLQLAEFLLGLPEKQ